MAEQLPSTDHEREHGNRAPVLQVITARLEELAGGAEPAPGDRRNAPPVSGAAGGSPVPPAHSPDGNTPLRHGVYQQTPARGRDQANTPQGDCPTGVSAGSARVPAEVADRSCSVTPS